MVLTERESEILGILFGDGCLSRTERSVLITITGNKVDDEKYLLGHIRSLFLKVFDLELTSRYRHDENTMDLYRHSKKIASVLHSWGMPFGLKKLEDRAPARIGSDQLRGSTLLQIFFQEPDGVAVPVPHSKVGVLVLLAVFKAERDPFPPVFQLGLKDAPSVIDIVNLSSSIIP